MKNFVVVTLALGTALAFIPYGIADSFGYKTSGSNDVAKFAIKTNDTGFGSGVAQTGTFAMSDASSVFSVRNGSEFNAGIGGRAAKNSDSINFAGDGGLPLDNILNQSNPARRILDRSGVLVDLSGSEVNLLIGAFVDTGGTSVPAKGHLNSGDKSGSHVNDGISKVSGDLAASAATLAATPEPGSLFLLGTGLFCMALVLFRRAAKRSTDS